MLPNTYYNHFSTRDALVFLEVFSRPRQTAIVSPTRDAPNFLLPTSIYIYI